MDGDAPPNTVGVLADRLGVAPSRGLARALDTRTFKARALCFFPAAKKGQPLRAEPDVPIYRHRDAGTSAALGHILDFVLRRGRGARSLSFTAAELGKKVRGEAGALLRRSLDRALREGALPQGFGAIRRAGTLVVFRVQDAILGRSRPVLPSGPERFESAFHGAFEGLDRRGLNFVKLRALREALPEFSRAQFDAGLRQLRLASKYELSADEGTHSRLDDEDREAGLYEAGARLVYCQRIL